VATTGSGTTDSAPTLGARPKISSQQISKNFKERVKKVDKELKVNLCKVRHAFLALF